MKKRFILFVLIATLLLTLLISCDKTPSDPAGTTVEGTPTLAPNTEDSSTAPSTEDTSTAPSTEDTTPEENTFTNLLMYSFSNGDLDGCIAEGCKTTVQDGILHLVCDTAGSPNRYDPKINISAEDMPLKGSDYTTCEIKFKYDVTNRTTHSTSTLFFWYGAASSDFYYIEHYYDSDSSGDEWITVRFDLSEMLLWKNNSISKIRWDPFECVGTCDIDYIAFYDGVCIIEEDDIPSEPSDGPTIANISDDCVVVKDQQYTLSVSASGGVAPYTYSWSDGTNEVGTTASITLSKSVAGTFNYTCTVKDANKKSITSDSVEVVVAANYLAYNFNTDGDNEGWKPNSCLGTAEVLNGVYHLVSDTPSVAGGSRYDPTLLLPGLQLNGSDYTKCTVTYKYDFGNAVKDYQATLFYWDSTNTVKSIEFIPSSTVSEDYVTMTFNLESWSNLTITQLRFDICECQGTAYIDSIIFTGN